MVLNFLLLIAAYILGSVPSAVWIGKRFYGVDVRKLGSKNAGATNTMRVLGRKAALPVFAIDLLKGFAAVELSSLSAYSSDSSQMFFLQILLAAVAVTGHIFPIFAGFKGGKGVATIAGAALAMATIPLLCTIGTFVVVLLLTKYVSLSSMIAALSFPLYLIFIFKASIPMVVFGFVVALMLVITHRKNIGRLIKGTESKIYIIKPKER